MKKAALIVMAVAVAVMFAVPAFAAESTPCSSCAKPCATPCAKPCSPCATPCAPLPKVSVNWAWPTMKVEPCAPCAAPCAKTADQFIRDVRGMKVPTQTYKAGNANTDKATQYESAVISGQ
jgi:hypothetical protein